MSIDDLDGAIELEFGDRGKAERFPTHIPRIADMLRICKEIRLISCRMFIVVE